MEELKPLMELQLMSLQSLIQTIKEEKLENTQEALNWIDSINKLSVEF